MKLLIYATRPRFHKGSGNMNLLSCLRVRHFTDWDTSPPIRNTLWHKFHWLSLMQDITSAQRKNKGKISSGLDGLKQVCIDKAHSPEPSIEYSILLCFGSMVLPRSQCIATCRTSLLQHEKGIASFFLSCLWKKKYLHLREAVWHGHSVGILIKSCVQWKLRCGVNPIWI